jgi:site-specific DNA-cytosine methylase
MKNREIIQIGNLNRSNGGIQPFQQDRIYLVDGGLLPALSAQLSSGGIIIGRLAKEQTMADNALIQTEENKNVREIMLHGKKVRVIGIRRLTPTECARLQTIPTWYKWECSDSQAYRMLGNGWCCEVIKHIFSFLPKEWFGEKKDG